jgi:hypothetical protein
MNGGINLRFTYASVKTSKSARGRNTWRVEGPLRRRTPALGCVPAAGLAMQNGRPEWLPQPS